MEVLKSMKQEMKERDNQLKLQLQLRDEYMEAELRRRDKNLKDALKKRDEEWIAELEKRDQYLLNSMAHCKQSFQLMTYDKVNNRAFLESLAKRRRELIGSNAKILDWTMKTISNKRKVSFPQIRITNYVPYTIVPPGETNPVLPFLNPNPNKERPSKPCKEPAKNKAPGITKKKKLTSVEEVEEYLRMEAAKEKAGRSKK